MSRQRPFGNIAFTGSASPDVVAHVIYFAETAEELSVENIDYDAAEQSEVAVVEGQTEYSVAVPENAVARDGQFFFAVVAKDGAGNLSDPSAAVQVSVDVVAPVPPTNVRYES